MESSSTPGLTKTLRSVISTTSKLECVPLERTDNKIHIPLYLNVYRSAQLARDTILDPYATVHLLTSLKSSMPLVDYESKVNRWDLFSTNSAMNFNSGVVTCSNLLSTIIAPSTSNVKIYI